MKFKTLKTSPIHPSISLNSLSRSSFFFSAHRLWGLWGERPKAQIWALLPPWLGGHGLALWPHVHPDPSSHLLLHPGIQARRAFQTPALLTLLLLPEGTPVSRLLTSMATSWSAFPDPSRWYERLLPLDAPRPPEAGCGFACVSGPVGFPGAMQKTWI